MHTLFYYTGAVVWVAVAVTVVFVAAFIGFEMIGATIFWIRVLRAGRRAQIKTSLSEKLGLWWSILTRQGRGTWTIMGSGEKVKYPRPWYNKDHDRKFLPA